MKRSGEAPLNAANEAKTKSNAGSVQPVPFDDAWRFLLKVGEAAQRYGSTAPRLQVFLQGLAQSIGYEGVFQATPANIVFALREAPGRTQRIEVLRVGAAGLDLNKLARLGDLLNDVGVGRASLREATSRLDEIDRIAPPWGWGANLAAPLLGGGWPDAWFAMFLSAVIYGVVLLSDRLGTLATDWLPLSSAFVAGSLATLAKVWIPELNLVLVILAAIAVLLPGYKISLGVVELVAQYVVSGTANLMSGLVYISKQFLGAWLGFMLVSSLIVVPTAGPAVPANANWMWLLVPLINISLCVVFQTSYRDFIWTFLACTVAYLGIWVGSVLVGGNLGLGTIVAVAFANLWARWMERPTSIALIPAIVLLVSGSIGFRGLASIATGQVAVGEQQFLQMFVVALTNCAGLLLGNTIFRPKITL
jgi:uncharacterized membrane protein YjjP (DUF1212 family)